jgi:hypothetical protein
MTDKPMQRMTQQGMVPAGMFFRYSRPAILRNDLTTSSEILIAPSFDADPHRSGCAWALCGFEKTGQAVARNEAGTLPFCYPTR